MTIQAGWRFHGAGRETRYGARVSEPELPPLPDDVVARFNRIRAGFNELLGLRFVAVGYEEVIGEIELGPQHTQPYGLVHGGVYASMVETLSSVGAALNLDAVGRHAVGLDNTTSFLKAARGGTLCGRAVPLARGRRTQVWEAELRCQGALVASGRVRLLGIEKGAQMAGEQVRIHGADPDPRTAR